MQIVLGLASLRLHEVVAGALDLPEAGAKQYNYIRSLQREALVEMQVEMQAQRASQEVMQVQMRLAEQRQELHAKQMLYEAAEAQLQAMKKSSTAV